MQFHANASLAQTSSESSISAPASIDIAEDVEAAVAGALSIEPRSVIQTRDWSYQRDLNLQNIDASYTAALFAISDRNRNRSRTVSSQVDTTGYADCEYAVASSSSTLFPTGYAASARLSLYASPKISKPATPRSHRPHNRHPMDALPFRRSFSQPLPAPARVRRTSPSYCLTSHYATTKHYSPQTDVLYVFSSPSTLLLIAHQLPGSPDADWSYIRITGRTRLTCHRISVSPTTATAEYSNDADNDYAHGDRSPVQEESFLDDFGNDYGTRANFIFAPVPACTDKFSFDHDSDHAGTSFLLDRNNNASTQVITVSITASSSPLLNDVSEVVDGIYFPMIESPSRLEIAESDLKQ
ncbi:uncharacterized protein V1518DRAFT_453645 [Limtongia smithiae]|uniref:uncharacterized protein n=1 Tax=Limtongia smithiae TaxID=1125753 RepID=UPI0034CF6EC5